MVAKMGAGGEDKGGWLRLITRMGTVLSLSLSLRSISFPESWFSSWVRDVERIQKEADEQFFFFERKFSLMTALLPFSGVATFHSREFSELKI